MIEVTDLVVSYHRAPRNAVDGVSFVAPRGQPTALAGPNGSGKSSIVRALLRRADVIRGEVRIDGRDCVNTLSYAEWLATCRGAAARRSRVSTRVREYAR